MSNRDWWCDVIHILLILAMCWKPTTASALIGAFVALDYGCYLGRLRWELPTTTKET